MNRVIFNENELPMSDLETIGLAAGGQLLLNAEDLQSLLSGRRTGMLQLHNLEAENIKIKSMDAKISVRKNELGKTELFIHPIYKKPATPDFLDDFEAKQLEKGELPSLLKVTKDGKGNTKEVLVEYDKETREFIVSDIERIVPPDMINNEFLTAAQKENYRKGKEVKLTDGTRLNYSATDTHGIRSNRIALVASILIDGGLTYVLYRGLNALFNEKRDKKDAAALGPGYYNAVKDMENKRIEINAESPEPTRPALKR